MGNKYTHDYEPKEKFDNILSRQYKPKEFDKLMKKIKIIDDLKRYHITIDKDKNFDKNIKDFFCKKYGPFLDIQRFIIPIIGVINSGKSTFMNNLLNLQNVLQIGDKVTTRFAAIIRHDKNANIPEIYNVEIQKRGTNGFNFKEKGKNLLKSNQSLAKIIEELNKDIEEKQNSDKYLYDPEKFFLIIRTKISLFEGEFEDYGNFIDFLDIPGLDEVNNEYNCLFDDYIQMIFSNILFPIFIFDIKSFENDNAKNIFKKFLDLYTKNIRNFQFKVSEQYDKGFIILNKIDLLNENKENIYKKFIQDYSELNLSNGKNIKILINKNINFFGISATKLSSNKKTNLFIDTILEDIISESKKSKFNSFKKFIKTYLLEKYNIDLNKSNEENYELKERLNITNNLLKISINNLKSPEFNLKEFTFLSQINNDNNNNEFEKINKNLFFQMQTKIKKELDEFLNFDFEGISQIDLTELNKKKEALLNNGLFRDQGFIIKINKEALNLFPNDLNIKYKKSNEIVETINEFSKFFKEKYTRIIFIGIISSGKTSLLNSIIGNNYNILETTANECTKSIYRIKYSSKISFCESKMVRNNFGSYFEDIEQTKIFKINEIKNKIINLNKEGNFKYYTLYVPIEALKNIKNKEKIELIDLPGINKNIAEIKIDLKELIDVSDGFIFNFNSLNIADENSQYIFTKIIENIKERNDSFNFENCLFNLNWIDEIQSDLLDNKIKEFKETITKNVNTKIYTGNFLYKMIMKEKLLSSRDINVSYFSNLFYKNYLDNAYEIESLNFIKGRDSWKIIYDDLTDEYENLEDLILEISDANYSNEINKKIYDLKKKSIIPKDEVNIKKIAKFLISFEKNKKKLIKSYESSKANIFFEKFSSQMNSSIENNQKNIFKKFNNYLINLFFQLFFLNELCLNEGKIDEFKNNIERKKMIIEKEYSQITEIIKNKFLNKEKILDEYKENIISLITNKEKLDREQIYEIIKKSGIENKITSLMKYLDNEIKKIEIDFYFFCIKEIADLLKDLDSFQNILDNISLSFRVQSGNGIFYASSIIGGLLLASSYGASIATTSFGLSLGAIGVGYSLFGLIIALPFAGYEIYQRNKSNDKKVADYFDDIKRKMNNIKDKYIKGIADKKKEFILNLEKSKDISDKEILFLKQNNYIEKFKKFINLLKT